MASALNSANVSAQTQSASATGMLQSSGTPASYLYHAAAAYGGNPLISLQHHPHQSTGLSTSPALAAALAAQQANASQHLQFYDTSGATTAGYHHQVSSAGQTAGTGTPANQSSVNAGLSSAANVVRFQSKDRSNLYFFFVFLSYHFIYLSFFVLIPVLL